MSIRTDLAIESREIYRNENESEIPGVEVHEEDDGNIKVTTVKVKTDEGEKIIGKMKGTYITMNIPTFTHYDSDTMDEVSRSLAKVLSSLVKVDKNTTTMVIGLGNWNITPDSLGPKVVSKLMVTRHLKQLVPDTIDEGISPVCAMAPGVLGITGIETSEVVKSVVDKIKPDLLICVDALAARRMDRVNRTIQIGDTGIAPGSGVGNKRKELNEKTLGIPVIAIGVPTVVDAGTMANDTIDLVIDEMIKNATEGGKFYNMLKSVNKQEKENLINEVLRPYIGELIVTPKEVDVIIESISKVIANGVNITLQPALDLQDINRYLN